MGLYDAILIKDNHLCISKEKIPDWSGIVQLAFKNAKNRWPEIIIQIEVDTLSQLETILPLEPNIVLLDNMSLHDLRTAVDMRANLPVLLEASGGVNLKSIREIAETGVERISVGALTHSAINFDWGMDWQSFDRLLTN
jgi:nicotinate-nucleotide pyrophosphorylase (carboxylating)